MSLTYACLLHKRPYPRRKVAFSTRNWPYRVRNGQEMASQGIETGAQIGSEVRFSRKMAFSRKNTKNTKNGLFGGRPYRPLFTVNPCTMPTESLGPWKPDFQKRPLGGKSDFLAFFRLFRLFSTFSRKTALFPFLAVLHVKKCLRSPKKALRTLF